MEKWEGWLVEFNGESDHVHLLLQYNPQTEPSKLINNLKTVFSRYLRKEFAYEIVASVESSPHRVFHLTLYR